VMRDWFMRHLPVQVHETGRHGQSSGLSQCISPIDLGMGISRLRDLEDG
jgi:hypothetical protein